MYIRTVKFYLKKVNSEYMCMYVWYMYVYMHTYIHTLVAYIYSLFIINKYKKIFSLNFSV